MSLYIHISGCLPTLSAQLHIPSEMLSNAILRFPSLEYMLMLWRLKFEFGMGLGLWWGGLSYRVLLLKEKEMRPFLSTVTPGNKNNNVFCLKFATCWIRLAPKQPPELINSNQSKADVQLVLWSCSTQESAQDKSKKKSDKMSHFCSPWARVVSV